MTADLLLIAGEARSSIPDNLQSLRVTWCVGMCQGRMDDLGTPTTRGLWPLSAPPPGLGWPSTECPGYPSLPWPLETFAGDGVGPGGALGSKC